MTYKLDLLAVSCLYFRLLRHACHAIETMPALTKPRRNCLQISCQMQGRTYKTIVFPEFAGPWTHSVCEIFNKPQSFRFMSAAL